MYRKLLIALAILLATVGGAFADDSTETAEAKGKWLLSHFFLWGEITQADHDGFHEGKGMEARTIDVEMQLATFEGGEAPVKYRIDWTNGGKFPKLGATHAKARRGSVIVDHADYEIATELVTVPLKMSIGPGKTLRVRVRAIYADKTRGASCVYALEPADVGKTNGWYISSYYAFC